MFRKVGAAQETGGGVERRTSLCPKRRNLAPSTVNICQVDALLVPRILLLLVFTELTETEAELEQSFTEGKTAKPVSGFLNIRQGILCLDSHRSYCRDSCGGTTNICGLSSSGGWLSYNEHLSLKIVPPTRFTQQELKEGKLHVTELTDKWYQDIQASPLLSGDCNKFGKTLPF